jgi:hypothetical protein
MTTATHHVAVPREKPVEVTVTDIGTGQPFLLLHGGAGLQSVQPFGGQEKRLPRIVEISSGHIEAAGLGGGRTSSGR